MKRWELRDAVMDRASDTNGAVASKAVINQWLNLAVRYLWRYYPWSFAVRTASVNTADGVATIALPADAQRPKKVRNTDTLHILRPKALQWVRTQYPDETSKGEPLYYTDGGLTQSAQTSKPVHSLRLAPVPDAVYPLAVDYLVQPTAMTSDQHYPPLPEDFDEAIILWCVIRSFRKMDDLAQAAEHANAFSDELQTLVTVWGGPWQVDEFAVIQDTDEVY